MVAKEVVFKGMEPTALMESAVEIARIGIAAGQSPFGCVIARDNAFLAVAHNTVAATTDITAHAEVNAIRQANKLVGEIHLPGAIVATTCEPCPMCMAALHWAGVKEVYFGASIADAEAAGFRELRLSAESLVEQGESGVKLVSGVLADSCRELFASWLQNDERQSY